jgi:thiosulfate reductase cytochrome b subunit
MAVKRLYLHPPLERIWHAVHTLGIVMLCLTGAHIHWPEAFPLFGTLATAMTLHNVIGVIVAVDFALWVPYILISRRVRYYLPLKRDFVGGIIKQAMFYGFNIFRGGHHPFDVTEEQKFNPLQKWAYVGVMFGMVPLLIVTGALLLKPMAFAGAIEAVGGMRVVAIAHTVLAFAAAAFVISHLYMASMGYTVLDAYKSMVTGWALEADHSAHAEEEKKGDAAEDTPAPEGA